MKSCVTGIARISRDPEVKFTANQTAVVDLGLVFDSGYGDRKKAVFIDGTCWGKTAEVAGEYLKKGSAVYVEAELDKDEWEDQNSGQKRTKIKLNVRTIQLLPRNQGGLQDGASQGQAQTAGAAAGGSYSGDEVPF